MGESSQGFSRTSVKYGRASTKYGRVTRKGDASGIRTSGEVTVITSKSTAQWVAENLLLILTVGSVIVGAIIGIFAREAEYTEETIVLVWFPGDLFMAMLKMLVLPLIVCSIVSGLAQLDPKSSSKMGITAFIYYFATTTIAVILGIVLVIAIHPGEAQLGWESRLIQAKRTVSTLDTVLDILRNMFPENIVQACLSRAKTEYENTTLLNNETGKTSYKRQRKILFKDGTNILGIIVFFTMFGIISGQLAEKVDVVARFFTQTNEIIMKLVLLVMWFSPLGILSLIIGKLISVQDLSTTAAQLSVYMGTVLLGLFIHACITLPLIYFWITRRNPGVFIKGMLQAIVTALGTSSSAATLPVTLRCLEDNLKIDNRVTRFVVPIGTTINMDGTALYEAIAAVFIAQMNNISLSFGDLVLVSLTATAASAGAAAIPSAGLVTMILVLTAVDLPTEDISIVITVDWILDRVRTTVNVLGDAYGAGIVAHLSKNELGATDSKKIGQHKATVKEFRARYSQSQLLSSRKE
ncbi:excitatory amino acid transporter-like [Varroa destructor]|uniref:Amino acid transporter n=1 Tax=Varroa destructor TaxID=109461 RepID=A0A7M7MBP6_VARDE|nr:excitatory amino acid transporter-like [Varroa destructor]